MEGTKKKAQRNQKNEFVDDLNFSEGSDATYFLHIEGQPKEGQITRSQGCYEKRDVKGKNTISSNCTTGSTTSVEQKSSKSEHTDYIAFGPGGSAAYTLNASGKVKGARIARIHICNDC